MKKILISFLFVVVSSASGNDYGRTVLNEIKAHPGETLILDLGTGGTVNINGWDQDLVSVKARLSGEDWKDCEVNMERTAGGVRLSSRYMGNRSSHSTSFDFDIQVPQNFNVRLDSAGGGISIVSLNGSVNGTTGGGEINIRKANGSVELSTGGGEIKIMNSRLDGHVETGGGHVNFEAVSGNITGSSGSGIVIRASSKDTTAEAAEIEGKHGELRIAKAGGDVEIDQAPEGIRVATGGGRIHIGSAGFVSAETGGGDIQIDAVNGWVKATTGSGDVKIRLFRSSKQRQDADLTSGTGDIEVTLPSDFSMDLDLRIGYTRDDEKYGIISDFPVKIERSKKWSSREGTPRKYIYGTGKIAGGKNRIRIHTVNGSIRLRKID